MQVVMAEAWSYPLHLWHYHDQGNENLSEALLHEKCEPVKFAVRQTEKLIHIIGFLNVPQSVP